MSTVLVVSDIHYASAGERARGHYEPKSISSPMLRGMVRLYRHYFWRRDPFCSNVLLERFLAVSGPADLVVANGDFSCDSAFVGMADDAVFESVRECDAALRARFGEGYRAVIGDHELGKKNISGELGGVRLSSWRACGELGLKPFWRQTMGCYVVLGVTSTLVALPVFVPELLAEERATWEQLRREHLDRIGEAFAALEPGQKVILFCHDPTALPFLAQEDSIRSRLSQIEMTVIGHLHSRLFLWKSRLLAGMPVIRFLGNTVRRYSTALRDARGWKPFHVVLCPALGGIEALKDGGWLRLTLDPQGESPARVVVEHL